MALRDVSDILDERIDPIELEKFREIYEQQCRRGYPSAACTFAYATALVRSTKQDAREGIDILERLLREDPDDMAKRDYVYYLAIANARLKDYDRALAYVDILLKAESSNRQAVDLKETIGKKMRRDGIVGAAILGGGAALIVGGIAAAIFAIKKVSGQRRSE